MRHISRAFKMLPNWQKLAASIVIVGALQAVIAIAIPLAVARVIDKLSQNIGGQRISFGLIVAPIGLWMGLRLLLGAIEWLGEIAADNAFRAAAISFREKSVGKLEKLSISYYEKRRAGQIASEVNQSPFQFADWLTAAVDDHIPLILQALFALVVLAYKFFPIAIVVLCIALIYGMVVFRTMINNRKYWKVNRLNHVHL